MLALQERMRTGARDLPHGTRGIALVETLIASLILVTVASGVSWLLLWSAHTSALTLTRTGAAVAAQQKLEQLIALRWGLDEGGGRVSDLSTEISVDPVESGGPGLAPSPAAAASGNVPGYFDYVDRNGRWCGTGGTPRQGAEFLRRWAVQVLPADPLDTIVLTVRVSAISDTDRAIVTLQTVRTRSTP